MVLGYFFLWSIMADLTWQAVGTPSQAHWQRGPAKEFHVHSQDLILWVPEWAILVSHPSPLESNTLHYIGPGRTLKGILPCELREFEVSITRRLVNGDSNMETFAHFNWRIKYANFCKFIFQKHPLYTCQRIYIFICGNQFFFNMIARRLTLQRFLVVYRYLVAPPRTINHSELTSDSSQSGHRSFA